MTFLKNKKNLWLCAGALVFVTITGSMTYHGFNFKSTRSLSDITNEKLLYAKNNIKKLEEENNKLKKENTRIEEEINEAKISLEDQKSRISEITEGYNNANKLKNEFINIASTLSNETIRANLKIENLESELTNKDNIINDLTLNISKNEEEISLLLSELNIFKNKTLVYIDDVLNLSRLSLSSFDKMKNLDVINNDYYEEIQKTINDFINFLNEYKKDLLTIDVNVKNSKYLNDTIKLFYSEAFKNVKIIDLYRSSLLEYVSNKLVDNKNKLTELEKDINLKEEFIRTLEKEKATTLNKLTELESIILNLNTLIENQKLDIKNKNSIIDKIKTDISVQIDRLKEYSNNLFSSINIESEDVINLLNKTKSFIELEFAKLENLKYSNQNINGKNYKLYDEYINVLIIYNNVYSRITSFNIEFIKLIEEENQRSKSIINELEENNQKIRAKNVNLTNEIGFLNATIETNKNLINSYRGDIEILKTKLTEISNNNNILSSEKEEIIRSFEEKIEEKTRNINVLTYNNTNLESEINRLRDENKKLNDKLNALIASLENEKLKDLNINSEVAILSDKNDKLKVLLLEKDELISKLKTENSNINNLLLAANEENDNLTKINISLSNEIIRIEAERIQPNIEMENRLRDEIDSINKENESLRKTINELNKNIIEAEKNNEKLKETIELLRLEKIAISKEKTRIKALILQLRTEFYKQFAIIRDYLQRIRDDRVSLTSRYRVSYYGSAPNTNSGYEVSLGSLSSLYNAMKERADKIEESLKWMEGFIDDYLLPEIGVE